MSEHVAQIFTGVLAAREVQRNPLSLLRGYDATGEHTGAVIRRFARHPQHPHAGVVIVQHLALRRLPDRWDDCMEI